MPKERQAKADTEQAAPNGVPHLSLMVAPANDLAGSGGKGVVVTGIDPDGPAADEGSNRRHHPRCQRQDGRQCIRLRNALAPSLVFTRLGRRACLAPSPQSKQRVFLARNHGEKFERQNAEGILCKH
jgi:hypothetical protein